MKGPIDQTLFLDQVCDHYCNQLSALMPSPTQWHEPDRQLHGLLHMSTYSSVRSMNSVPNIFKRFNASCPFSPNRFDRREPPSRRASRSFNISAVDYCVVVFSCDDRFADLCPLHDVCQFALAKTSTASLAKYAALTGSVGIPKIVVRSPESMQQMWL